MTYQEIINAVDSGKKVYYGNKGYQVEKWKSGIDFDYNIVCQFNGHASGLYEPDLKKESIQKMFFRED